jgi:Flp pilus assembly protein TadD
MLLRAAQSYVRSSDGEGGALTARILSSFAARLEAARLTGDARRLFERALELDGTNREALLALGADLERRGACREAISHLERLIAVDPKNPEGRLRLALCLARAGDSEESSRMLARIVGESNPEWILALAFQELAKLRLEQEDAPAAEAVLRRGLSRLPDEQGIRLLLAYVLDRQRRSREAWDLVAGLRPARSSAGASPRLRYNLRSAPGLDEEERSLERIAKARLPALARALDRSSAGGR